MRILLGNSQQNPRCQMQLRAVQGNWSSEEPRTNQSPGARNLLIAKKKATASYSRHESFKARAHNV